MPNLRLAVRTLARAPFVTLVAIGSLALGIGANTAIYSVFHQMLLRPLPVADPGRLVNLSTPGPKSGSTSCSASGGCDEVLSYPMYRDLEARQRVLAGLAAHRSFGANLSYQGQTLDASATYVSGSYFPVLGRSARPRPAAGSRATIRPRAPTSWPSSGITTGRPASAPTPASWTGRSW